MQALERVQRSADIPRYCYHPGMPIAGTCRMCTVEVEKMPKLMTSCSTQAGEGMVVHTQSERVKKSRTGVMEFLLGNHPLDCPVCDKAGECELQDYNFTYGPHQSRFQEEKRVFEEATTKKLSEHITLNMNRCVHCERCVRFTDEVTKTNDLVMINRGWKKELAAADEERGLWNDYQGCLTDFCPVGALTFNDFRFHKRVWFLDKKPSVCDGCSKGCNIEVHSDQNLVYRYKPIFNQAVNGHWMCDEGRLSYKNYMDPLRIGSPLLRAQSSAPANQGELVASSWDAATQWLHGQLASVGSNCLLVVASDATLEEMQFLKQWAKQKKITLAGYSTVASSQEDQPLDHLLRKSDKSPNTRGLERLEIPILTAQDPRWQQAPLVLYVGFGRTPLPAAIQSRTGATVLFGVWSQELTGQIKNLVALLPGLSTLEKSGSFINDQNIEQRFAPAIKALGHSKALSSFFQTL
jgi:NADH-quinone oxidoreductase subunit G